MKIQVQIYSKESNQYKYDKLGSISCLQRTAKYRKISESWNLNYIVLAGYLFSNNSGGPQRYCRRGQEYFYYLHWQRHLRYYSYKLIKYHLHIWIR